MMSCLNSIKATHFVRLSLVHFYVMENYKRADNLRVVRYMPYPLINSNLHFKGNSSFIVSVRWSKSFPVLHSFKASVTSYHSAWHDIPDN